MALRKAATLFSGTPPSDLPESFGYSLKRRLLGPPMVNEELRDQRLSKVLALGVLSPDGISSSAYGTEEMLIELLPLFGLAAFAVILPMTGVTVVLPRRSYPPLLGRLLHDQTADKIARVVSRLPRSVATIIPFDVEARLDVLHERQTKQGVKALAPEAKIREHGQPAVRPGVTPIGSVVRNGRATVEGRVHSLEIRPVDHSCVLACQVTDATGEITALFYGRTHIPGVEPGAMIQLRGRVGIKDAGAVMVNPAYELLP